MPRTSGGRVKQRACANGVVGRRAFQERLESSGSTRATGWTSFASALVTNSPSGCVVRPTTTEAMSQYSEHACARSAERADLYCWMSPRK